jgi:hypothetical protein
MRMTSAGHVCTKIFKPATLKCYVLTEGNEYVTEDNPEPRTEFWEWFLWSLDTIFDLKLNGTTTKPCYVIPWGPHNHLEEVLNLQGFPVSCVL